MTVQGFFDIDRITRGWSTLQKSLFLFLMASFSIHVLSLMLGWTYFRDLRWVSPPFHSVIENTGAIIAFLVAFLLLAHERREEGTSYNVRIAGALLAMGALDLFHAMVNTIGSFVFLHSGAILLGGVFFALVWLPGDWFRNRPVTWPLFSLIFSVAVGIGTLFTPDRYLIMLEGEAFSSSAVLLNTAGGILLMMASIRLYESYRQSDQLEDLLFAFHCFLFASVGFMFSQSVPWGFTWWSWHGLRLLAYGVALVFAVECLVNDQRLLRERKDELERRVRDRTEELDNALREKEILLEELHHRVKNNLQVISSILSLQSNQHEDPEFNEQFDEVSRRVQSMAMVHDLLHQSDDTTQLEFSDYVGSLSDELVQSLSSPADTIELHLDVEEIRLGVEQSTFCGLILNELITNCIKHAFEPGQEGTIRVRFRQTRDNLELTVSDNGHWSGPEPSTDTESIGLGVVESLATIDLGGSLEIDRTGGTMVTVRFPEK